MKKVKILYTAFEPFNHKLNASKILLKELHQIYTNEEIHFQILPCDSKKITQWVKKEAHFNQYDFCVLTGQAPYSQTSIEKIAINCKYFDIPDNNQYQPKDEKIDIQAPLAMDSTLLPPLSFNQTKAKFSYHAGTYLCNQTLFETLNHIKQQQFQCRACFIHIPLLPQQAKDFNLKDSQETAEYLPYFTGLLDHLLNNN